VILLDSGDIRGKSREFDALIDVLKAIEGQNIRFRKDIATEGIIL